MIVPLVALEPSFNAWHVMVALLTVIVPVLVGAAVLVAIYWVIRRAVASGIRDARRTPLAPEQLTSEEEATKSR